MSGGIDFIAKFRNIFSNLGFPTRKRKADDETADYQRLGKYSRVSNDFPKIITKPFEGLIYPVHTVGVSLDDFLIVKRDPIMNSRRNNHDSPRNKITYSNIPLYAEMELSDNEDDSITAFQPCNRNFNQRNMNTVKFSSSGYNKPKVINIPIKIEKREPPPLIATRNCNINISKLTNGIPNLQPIRKGTCNIPRHFGINEQVNGFDMGFSNSSSRKKGPSPYSQNEDHSIIKESYNMKEKRNYQDLLNKLVPTLYMGKFPRHQNTLLSNKNDIINDHVNLPSAENKKVKVKGPVINLCDDDSNQAEDVIDLDENEIQIISAVNKLMFTDKKVTEKSEKKRELPRVEPVNSFKEYARGRCNKLDPKWLEDFKENSVKTSNERRKQIAEEEENASILSAETRRLERLVGEKFKNYRICADLIIIDDEEPEEEIEFPQFTEDDCRLLKNVIYAGSEDQILVSKFNLQITRRDIKTLLDTNWLNDEVINFYMNLLTDRGEKRASEGYPRVYSMNTFFIPRLTQSGYSGVRRWTKKVDLFSYDIIPIPVHVGGVHWCMAIIHLRNKTIKYYDSMGTPNPGILKALEEYLREESLDKKKRYLDTSDFHKESVRDIPKQMNGSDCGVFSCMFAEYICRNREITFRQENMPYFRQKMILEIVKGELML